MGEKNLESEVKSIISGLLTSTPLMCTINKLQRDYREMVGENIPYRKLGYNSIEHFLRSVPDIVEITGTGSFASLKPVSKKSAHINELVMKQKMPTKAPMVPRRRLQGPRQNNSIIHHPHMNMMQIGLNYPNGMIPRPHIPTVLGQPLMEQFYNQPMHNGMNGIVPQRHHSASSSNNYHNNRINHNPNNHYNNRNNHNPNNHNNNNNQNNRNNYNNNYSSHNNHNPNNHYNNYNNPNSQNPNNHNNNYKNHNPHNHSNDLSKNVNGVSKQTVTDVGQALSNMKISSEIPRDNPNSGKYEFIPDKIPRPIETIQMIPMLGIMNSYTQEYSKNVPKYVQENLSNLIARHPKGIWCRDLPKEYRKMFGEELNYLDYNYQSLIAMCIDLPYIFHYVRPSQEDFKMYDRKSPLPQEAEKEFTVASYTVKAPESMKQSFESLDLPSDIVMNELIPRRFVDAGVRAGDKIDIAISEIWDFNKFWVYIPDGRLDDLMDDMQEFYNKNSEKYSVPLTLVQEGLVCVCKFSLEYHRGIIVTVVESEPDVRVLLLDYGTVCRIPKQQLCFLAERFKDLPFQAIQCELGNVEMVLEDRLMRRTLTQDFYDLVNQRDIIALIQKIDREKQVLVLYLVDQETNKSINDIMREKVNPN